jgi:hypothetical protein
VNVNIERAEAPLAGFYQERQPWLENAACLGIGNERFFTEDRTGPMDWSPAREVCAACTVRTECCEQAMVEEDGIHLDLRFGIRGWTTPAQRESIERRGGLKGRDPMMLVQGLDNGRRVPPVPDGGDRWSRHHTTLARKVVRWLVDNVDVGGKLPTCTALAHELGCNPSPLRRVLDALVQDGTLDFVGKRTRGANGTNTSYTRRATPRAVGSWLPPHLRTADEEDTCG